MKKKKKRKTGRTMCAALALGVFLLLTACAGEDTGTDLVRQDTDWQTERAKQDRRTRQDQRTEPEDIRQITKINLDDHQNRIIIAQDGDVWLSGSLEGQVIVDVEEDELVHLYLAGAEISSSQGPAIEVEEASKVVVTLVSDTENVLTDSPDYTDYEESPACLYSACDLTINGDGTLRVYGYHEDGIRSKDRLKFLDGTIEVHAKGDGIRGNDGILFWNASVDIQSEGNGIRTANQGTDDRGVIEVKEGALSVVAGKKGIYAASDLYLYNCVCSVNAVEEKIKADGTAYIAACEKNFRICMANPNCCQRTLRQEVLCFAL